MEDKGDSLIEEDALIEKDRMSNELDEQKLKIAAALDREKLREFEEKKLKLEAVLELERMKKEVDEILKKQELLKVQMKNDNERLSMNRNNKNNYDHIILKNEDIDYRFKLGDLRLAKFPLNTEITVQFLDLSSLKNKMLTCCENTEKNLELLTAIQAKIGKYIAISSCGSGYHPK